MDQLPEWVKPGVSFRKMDTKYHVRGIVDGMAVIRWWRTSKRRWEYTVEDAVFFKVNRDYITDIEYRDGWNDTP